MSAVEEKLLAEEQYGPDAGHETVAQPKPSTHARLDSLDIMRGCTIALMIFADEIGEAYPHLNHSPWNNVTMADFVMPWFLFMVGLSMAFSFKKFARAGMQQEGTKYIIVRGLRIFFMGCLIQVALPSLCAPPPPPSPRPAHTNHPPPTPFHPAPRARAPQGGAFFESYEFGWNLWNIRWAGILQRIAWGYTAVGLLEIWLPGAPAPPPPGDTAGAGDEEAGGHESAAPAPPHLRTFTAHK
jgi:heparan-alpha-glucosaminide N-acetyltransferase